MALISRNNNIHKEEFMEDYRHDIFIMLLSMGVDRSAAIALIKTSKNDIEIWAGSRPATGSIVTPQMAARMIVRASNLNIESGL